MALEADDLLFGSDLMHLYAFFKHGSTFKPVSVSQRKAIP